MGPMVWPRGIWPRAKAALDLPRRRAGPPCPQEEGRQSRSPGHRRGRQQGVGDPKTENRLLLCPCLHVRQCHNCLTVHLKQINNNASVSGKSWTLKSPVMSRGKYLLLCFLFFLALYGKRVVKRPNAPADFAFLVPERDLLVKIKTSVETVQYSIEINMDEQRWDWT